MDGSTRMGPQHVITFDYYYPCELDWCLDGQDASPGLSVSLIGLSGVHAGCRFWDKVQWVLWRWGRCHLQVHASLRSECVVLSRCRQYLEDIVLSMICVLGV